MKITNEYAIIETAEEAVMFLGQIVYSDDDDGRRYPSELRGIEYAKIWKDKPKSIIIESPDYDASIDEYKPMVTREQTLEAMLPKKGRQVRAAHWTWVDSLTPILISSEAAKRRLSKLPNNEWLVVDDNALTTGTCGEIRELLEWAFGE